MCALAYAFFRAMAAVSLRLETRFDRVVVAKHERVGNPSIPTAGRREVIVARAMQSESKNSKSTTTTSKQFDQRARRERSHRLPQAL